MALKIHPVMAEFDRNIFPYFFLRKHVITYLVIHWTHFNFHSLSFFLWKKNFKAEYYSSWKFFDVTMTFEENNTIAFNIRVNHFLPLQNSMHYKMSNSSWHVEIVQLLYHRGVVSEGKQSSKKAENRKCMHAVCSFQFNNILK